jgi:hypothetical protein
MTKAAANQAVKKYVFWEGDGTASPISKPVFHEEPTTSQPIFQVCVGLLYRADRVADRVAESSRMQENL